MTDKKDIGKIVKDSFESKVSEAPEDLWSGVSDKLDQQDFLNNKVKESFEKSSLASAPDLWSSLSGDLDSNPNVDSHIKNSFDNQSNWAPESTWEKVQNNLDINTVWSRIADELDRKPLFVWWRIAAVIALLISLIGVTGGLLVTNHGVVHNTQLEMRENNDVFKRIIYEGDKYEAIANRDHHSTREYLNLLSMMYGKDNSAVIYTSNIHHSEIVNNQELEDYYSMYSNAGDEFNRDPIIDKMDLSTIDLLPNAFHVKNPTFEVQEIKLENETHRPLSIGIIGGINNSWILNNNIKNSFGSESLISSSLSFGENFGIVADYNFANDHGLSSELFINSRARQRVSFYNHGNYVTETTEVNYYKGTLMYSTRKQFYGKRLQHNLVLRAGGYFAINNKSSMIVNETITSYNSNFTKFDYGLRATLSEEFDQGRWVFGYGIQSETGLKNIQTEANNVPSFLNVASNFNLGVFVNLRYKL